MSTLILPRSAIQILNDDYVKVEIPEDSKELSRVKTNWDVVEKSRGILKERKIDPVEYQRKVRDEWNERL